MRTLCDAYYEEHESHYRAFLDISDFLEGRFLEKVAEREGRAKYNFYGI